MKRFKLYLLPILCWIIVCCKGNVQNNAESNVNVKKEQFISFLKDFKKDYKRYKKIILIPGSGCTGCINEAETYFAKNVKNKDNLYIFTIIGDIKVFKLNIFKDLYMNDNVIVDSDNKLLKKGFRSV